MGTGRGGAVLNRTETITGRARDEHEHGTSTGRVREQDGIETEREWTGTGRERVMDGKILQWNHKW